MSKEQLGLGVRWRNGLRTVLAHENQPLCNWDRCLDTVVFVINNRILRIHGFTPSQLFLGISPRARAEDITIRDEMVGALLVDQDFHEDVEKWKMWMTIAQTEERHDLARGSILAAQDRQIEMRQQDLDRKQVPVVRYQPGDLVLLRRFAVDKDKGRKLEAKWEGPYRIARITKSEVSVWLEDLCTGAKKG